MAELTPEQRAMAEAMLAATFSNLGLPAKPLPKAPTAAQMQAIRSVPANSFASTYGSPYLTAEERSLFAQQYGNAYGPQPQTNPAVAAATSMAANVPLPRPRPWDAPTRIDLAAINALPPVPGPNPALEAAIKPGSSLDDLLAYAKSVNSTPKSKAASPAAIAAAALPRLPAIPSTNGYLYQNGQKVGLADWAQGLTPAQQYAMANARGQIAATDPTRRVGTTPVQQIQRSNGMSSASAYDAANAAAAARAVANATRPVYQSSGGGGSNDWFASVTRA